MRTTTQTKTTVRAEQESEHLPWRLVGAVMAGTLLNPLNSSMIAVAILSLSAAFRVDTVTATWLISGFYLAGAIGMPLMGRLADLFGPRRVFSAGLLLVALTGASAPFAPAFGWLLLARVVQAFGTAAAFPAGLAIIRAQSQHGRAPAAALGAVSIASSVSAALGPVLGGGLVTLAGWPAIFLVNVPVSLVGLALARRWLPPDPARVVVSGEAPSGPTRGTAGPTANGAAPGRAGDLASRGARPGRAGHAASRGAALDRVAGGAARSRWGVLRTLDLPGVALFSGVLASLLGFLLSLSDHPLWPLLPLAALAALSLLWREWRVSTPFLDVRLLAANRVLSGVYAQFAAVNLVFYTIFFGLPLWLEQARRFTPDATGLLMLPVAGVGVLATPLAARIITRTGPQPALIVGAAMLLVGSLLPLLFNAATNVPVLLVVGGVLGVPNGFNNLGLQAALYEAAPPQQMGAVSGLFQTSRYTGAILSTALIGLVMGAGATSARLHTLAVVIAAVSALLVVASILARRSVSTRAAA